MLMNKNTTALFFSFLICVITTSIAVAESSEDEFLLPLLTSVYELPIDEENRLIDHYLLIIDLPHCAAAYSPQSIGYLERRASARISGELAYQFFGVNTTDEYTGPCSAVCLERGTHFNQLLNPLPYHINSEGEDIANWVVQSCQAAEVGFINYADNDCNIYFVNRDGEEIFTSELLRKEANTVWQQSFLGHQFRVRDAVTEEVLLDFVVEFNSINPVGFMSNRDLEIGDVPGEVEYFLKDEFDRAREVKRTFTEVGFNRGRLPPDLFGSISAYHYNNRDNRVPEEWNDGGVIVNWWEAEVWMIHMPSELKRYWQSRLKELVEAWAGVELELTDIYGMRRYEEGARLLTHVDRVNTHAASLIVNVAQEAIREPWMVEIYDFAGRLHEVEMNEGDIVYYESARCLHGRMQPLHGGYYVNLFSHYRPAGGDPLWYTHENPHGTPEHLLEVGQCQSNGTKATCSLVGEDVLPFLSPKLETLTGPNDLFKFWEKVSPEDNGNSMREDL